MEIKNFFEALYTASDEEQKVRDLKPGNLISGKVFNESDVDKAINECNFAKAFGPDEFDGSCIKKDDKTRVEIRKFVLNSLNKN